VGVRLGTSLVDKGSQGRLRGERCVRYAEGKGGKDEGETRRVVGMD
jgi:hypothetical protein